MHACNGVSNFPDPREGPNGGGVGWPGGGPVMISSDVLLIMGQPFAGPVVASAAKDLPGVHGAERCTADDL